MKTLIALVLAYAILGTVFSLILRRFVLRNGEEFDSRDFLQAVLLWLPYSVVLLDSAFDLGNEDDEDHE